MELVQYLTQYIFAMKLQNVTANLTFGGVELIFLYITYQWFMQMSVPKKKKKKKERNLL